MVYQLLHVRLKELASIHAYEVQQDFHFLQKFAQQRPRTPPSPLPPLTPSFEPTDFPPPSTRWHERYSMDYDYPDSDDASNSSFSYYGPVENINDNKNNHSPGSRRRAASFSHNNSRRASPPSREHRRVVEEPAHHDSQMPRSEVNFDESEGKANLRPSSAVSSFINIFIIYYLLFIIYYILYIIYYILFIGDVSIYYL